MRIRQNPDKEFVKEMKEQLADNDWYCPCSVVKTPDTKCMCRAFREMIEHGESGSCPCGLYLIE